MAAQAPGVSKTWLVVQLLAGSALLGVAVSVPAYLIFDTLLARQLFMAPLFALGLWFLASWVRTRAKVQP